MINLSRFPSEIKSLSPIKGCTCVFVYEIQGDDKNQPGWVPVSDSSSYRPTVALLQSRVSWRIR